VDRHGLRQCLGAVEVEARENPSGLAATKYRAASEAGYTSAVVTIEPDPVDLLQSGGVHIRPHMAQSERPERHYECPRARRVGGGTSIGRPFVSVSPL